MYTDEMSLKTFFGFIYDPATFLFILC